MRRFEVIGFGKVMAVTMGVVSALTGLWWLVLGCIGLYVLCVIEARR